MLFGRREWSCYSCFYAFKPKKDERSPRKGSSNGLSKKIIINIKKYITNFWNWIVILQLVPAGAAFPGRWKSLLNPPLKPVLNPPLLDGNPKPLLLLVLNPGNRTLGPRPSPVLQRSVEQDCDEVEIPTPLPPTAPAKVDWRHPLENVTILPEEQKGIVQKFTWLLVYPKGGKAIITGCRI